MDYISSFDIRLEKDVFYPGETISGVVLIESVAPLKLRGIRIFLRGRARVQWKVLKSGESRTLKDDQYLLDEKAVLWGRDRHQPAELDEDEQAQILPRGLHEMPFSFNLPASQFPCSLETKAGTIRYYVKVIVDVPYASSPQGIKYFTLIGPHIDCTEDKFMSPLSGQDHKVRWQGCCRRGVVALRAVLERSAYCCGEQLRLRLQLENRQDCPALLRVRLTQHLEYRIERGGGASAETKTVQSTALEWRSCPVPENSQLRIEPAQESALRVPVLPPTMVGFCRLLQLYYVLRVCVEEGRKCVAGAGDPRFVPSSSSECLEMDFPFTIGTVPQRPSHSQLYNVAYDFGVDHVETGKYISPEFRLGQVWDGHADEAVEDVILYRPVYVSVMESGREGDRESEQHQQASSPMAAGSSRQATDEEEEQRAHLHQQPQPVSAFHLPNGAATAATPQTPFPSVQSSSFAEGGMGIRGRPSSSRENPSC